LTVTGCAGEVSPGDSEPTDPGAGAPAAAVTPPPADTGFDYQLGGAYSPPEGTGIVVRDSTAEPAPGPGPQTSSTSRSRRTAGPSTSATPIRMHTRWSSTSSTRPVTRSRTCAQPVLCP